MTVGGLIERLSKYDHNMRVIVQGYEGGFDDCFGISDPVDIEIGTNSKDNPHYAWYFGEHRDPHAAPTHPVVKAIVLWVGPPAPMDRT